MTFPLTLSHTASPNRFLGFLSYAQVHDWMKMHVEIVLIIMVFIGFQYHAYLRAEKTATIINTPQQHDFFFVDYFALNPKSDPKYRFVPLKLMAIDAHNLTFKIGNIAHTTPVSPRDHMKFDNAMNSNFYRVPTLTLSRHEVADLFASGVIYDARRPRNIFIDGWIVLTLAELNTQP